jgi:hypothetical protein
VSLMGYKPARLASKLIRQVVEHRMVKIGFKWCGVNFRYKPQEGERGAHD